MEFLNQPVMLYLLSGVFTTSALFFVFKFFGVIICEQNQMRYFSKGKDVYAGFSFFAFYILPHLLASYYALSFLNISISPSVALIALTAVFLLLSGALLLSSGKVRCNFNNQVKEKNIFNKVLSDINYSLNLTLSLLKKVPVFLPFISILNSLSLLVIIDRHSDEYFLTSFSLVVLNYILICLLSALRKKRELIVKINLKNNKKTEEVELVFIDNNFIIFKDGETERILPFSSVEEVEVVRANNKERGVRGIIKK